jgi:hypothetical protein
LDSYTTDITGVIDVGIIAPLAFVTAVLLFRRNLLGYLLAPLLMMGNILIAVIVIVQTIFQSNPGIILSTGQLIGFVGSFVVMGLFALALTIQYHRNIKE